jgi:tRNA threonylcarbamoyladenosine biosynthesis protein TsaB
MARILLLETSTARLSVALAQDGVVVAARSCDEPRQQASLTAPMVKEVLDSLSLTMKDCQAVCVSKGPGSYTGLRVGVSTAKGLAFGAGIPLLSMGTLDVLVAGVLDSISFEAPGAKRPRGAGGLVPQSVKDRDDERAAYSFIVPMIDARRMEVYTAVFGPDGVQRTPVEAKVVGPDSFAEELSAGPVLFVGDGALKCREVLTHPNARFLEAWPDARHMAAAAEAAYQEKRFEDLAYFEPFYLKDFIATVSKKPW